MQFPPADFDCALHWCHSSPRDYPSSLSGNMWQSSCRNKGWMPLIEKLSGRERVEFNETLTHGEVAQLASDPDIGVLQRSAPVEANSCDLLNRNLFRRRPDIG